jgi:hypothetical protein
LITSKKILVIGIAVLFFGSTVFFLWENFWRVSPEMRECLTELRQTDNGKLAARFNDSLASNFHQKRKEIGELVQLWRSYIACRADYDFDFKYYQQLVGLVEKMSNLDGPNRELLLERINDSYYDRDIRLGLIYGDPGFICPGDKADPRIVEECVDIPARRGLAYKFYHAETVAACQNFCQDLIKYSRDRNLFFEEQKEIKTLTRYKMADILKIFLAIRFGGMDFALKEIEKFPTVEDRSVWRQNLADSITALNINVAGSAECSKKLDDLKTASCRFQSARF